MKVRLRALILLTSVFLFSTVVAVSVKDVGFKDTPFWIRTDLRANPKKIDEIRFSICDQKGKCEEVSSCWYSKDELSKALFVFGSSDFSAEANTLLAGSLMSSINSCSFQKNFLSWLTKARPDCKGLKGFKHCKGQQNCVTCGT